MSGIILVFQNRMPYKDSIKTRDKSCQSALPIRIQRLVIAVGYSIAAQGRNNSQLPGRGKKKGTEDSRRKTQDFCKTPLYPCKRPLYTIRFHPRSIWDDCPAFAEIQLLLWASWVVALVQDTLLDQLLRLWAILDLVLEVVCQHVAFQFAGVGLQCGGRIGSGEDVAYKGKHEN